MTVDTTPLRSQNVINPKVSFQGQKGMVISCKCISTVTYNWVGARGHQDTYSNKAIKGVNDISQQVWHSKVAVEKIKIINGYSLSEIESSLSFDKYAMCNLICLLFSPFPRKCDEF